MGFGEAEVQGVGKCNVGEDADVCLLFEGDCHGILSCSFAVVRRFVFGVVN